MAAAAEDEGPGGNVEDNGGADEGEVLGADGQLPDPADVQATLGSVASGLAEQLSSITEEMNKIRAELYGDSGIGGIAKELDKLKAGGLGGLLDGVGDLDARLGQLGAGLGAGASGLGLGGGPGADSARSSASSSVKPQHHRPSEAWDIAGEDDLATCDGPASSSQGQGGARGGGGGGGGASAGAARRRRTPEERDGDLEELRRKLMARNGAKGKGAGSSSDSSVSIWEKLALLFLVLVCLYIGSPFFRTTVRRAASMALFGEAPEGMEQEPDEGDILPDF